MTAICAICGGSESLALDRRDAVPVAQNLLFDTLEDALACPSGALDIRRCTGCGFVWNARFDPDLVAYGAAYDNDQGFSARFRQHTDEVAETIAARMEGAGAIDLLEIGCGQGGFMATVARALGDAWRSGLGFDPAWKGDCAELPHGAQIRGGYFGTGSLQAEDCRPNAVVSRHVIEHVPDPLAFLGEIRGAIAEGTPLFVETPNVDWVLERGALFDLYYEHCSLFTPHSLAFALAQAGFHLESVQSVFDDQYMLAIATAGTHRSATLGAGPFGDLGYRSRRARFLERISRILDERGRGGGRIAIWGGGSKGVTLSLVLPGIERIDCAVDINVRKQGTFMPGSGIPIVSPLEAHRRGVACALVMNRSYLEEVRCLCMELGLDWELVPVEFEAKGDL